SRRGSRRSRGRDLRKPPARPRPVNPGDCTALSAAWALLGRPVFVDCAAGARKNTGMNRPAEEIVEGILTLEEIQANYAPEWVLIGDIQTDENLQLRAGRVLFHSMDGEEVCRKATEFPAGRYALRYLGERPDDVALIL